MKMKLWKIASILNICISFNSCGGQKGDTKQVDKIIEDKLPPKFIELPKVTRITVDTAEIVFVVNEKSNGSILISDQTSLNLNVQEVDSSPDKIEFSAKAFETIRIKIEKLKADWQFKAFLTVTDEAGNSIQEPIISLFRTQPLLNESNLSGEPTPMKQGVMWSFTPNGVPDRCNLKMIEGPEWLNVSEDGGSITGFPVWKSDEKSISFKIAVVGDSCEDEKSFEVDIFGDPLFEYAWHMNKNTSKFFSWYSAAPEKNAILDATTFGALTGKGVRVAIVDSGMQINHPDLKNNIDRENSFNLAKTQGTGCVSCDPDDPTPPLKENTFGDQGTTVAGIIAAEGWNGIGSRGIAPEAKIGAYNLSYPEFLDVTDNDYLRIMNLNSDIICHSATPTPNILSRVEFNSFESYDKAQESKIKNSRNGKGIIYIKASGELGGEDGYSYLDQTNVTNWSMIIGSHNMRGKKSYHSSPGSNIWITAPGGEWGYQSDFNLISGTLIKPINFHPSVIGPDIFDNEFKCKMGFAKSSDAFISAFDTNPIMYNSGRSSGFNMGWNELNEDCQYTASLKSTPAAAGIAAGAVALLLEYNPNLSWRDVKYILAKTANPIDEAIPSQVVTVAGSPYEVTLPWITNAAGYRFHNWYGFGALDLKEALELANPKTYKPLPELVATSWDLARNSLNSIPPADIGGVITEHYELRDMILESVQIRVKISHQNVSHLGVELISPNGTRSVLKATQDGATFANLDDTVFLSNAFYGERSKGTWQLKIIDGKTGAPSGTLHDWYFKMTGHYNSGDTVL